MSGDEKQYGLEPHDEEHDTDAASPPGPGAPEAGSPGVESLDVCPNCGASLGEIDTVVCVRCGFDLKNLRQHGTKVGVEEKPLRDLAATGEPEQRPALCRPDIGGWWLPIAAGSAALALLLFGYLWGASGLFSAAEPVPVTTRLLAVLKLFLRTGLLALCGLGGVLALARLLGAALGDFKLAALRMLAIAAMVQIVLFLDLPNSPALERFTEVLLLAGAFVGLSMLLFRIQAQEALMLLGTTALTAAALLVLTSAIGWALVF